MMLCVGPFGCLCANHIIAHQPPGKFDLLHAVHMSRTGCGLSGGGGGDALGAVIEYTHVTHRRPPCGGYTLSASVPFGGRTTVHPITHGISVSLYRHHIAHPQISTHTHTYFVYNNKQQARMLCTDRINYDIVACLRLAWLAFTIERTCALADLITLPWVCVCVCVSSPLSSCV